VRISPHENSGAKTEEARQAHERIGRKNARTRADDSKTFLAHFVSFPSHLRRSIKSSLCSRAIRDFSGFATYQHLGLGITVLVL